MATFITSDWHFDHNNICSQDGFVPTRNHFESVEEMNEEIIKQTNYRNINLGSGHLTEV